MNTFLLTLGLAIMLVVSGTIISLRLHPRSKVRVQRRVPRRAYVVPGTYTTNANISVEDGDMTRYTRKMLATLIIILVILSTLIIGALHAFVAH